MANIEILVHRNSRILPTRKRKIVQNVAQQLEKLTQRSNTKNILNNKGNASINTLHEKLIKND